tara:strand:- start:1208 stop:1681 length:474 start_codon:yes stop_codon:yes gene_type:complete
MKYIFYDFDGVMTNNKVIIDEKGNEMVEVNRSDGLGVAEIKKLGIEQIILSTETNSVVSSRAVKLGIKCMQGIENKKETLTKYCIKNNIQLDNVAFVGNDINDKDVMKIVKRSFCPADAHSEIKKIASKVLITKGGDGVIRELLDILKKGKKDDQFF